MKKLILTVAMLLSAGMNAEIVELGNGLVADVIENGKNTTLEVVTYFGKTIATKIQLTGINISPDILAQAIQNTYAKQIASHSKTLAQAAVKASAEVAAPAVEAAAKNAKVVAPQVGWFKSACSWIGDTRLVKGSVSVYNTCTQPVRNFYNHPGETLTNVKNTTIDTAKSVKNISANAVASVVSTRPVQYVVDTTLKSNLVWLTPTVVTFAALTFGKGAQQLNNKVGLAEDSKWKRRALGTLSTTAATAGAWAATYVLPGLVKSGVSSAVSYFRG